MGWVEDLRSEFPGLKASPNWVLSDAAGGTQAHQRVVAAVAASLANSTANLGGTYPSAIETIRGMARARDTVAAFLNSSPEEVTFGANMTTLTLHVSRAIGRTLNQADNVVVTNLDHDGNVTPWTLMAEEKGIAVRRVNFKPGCCLLDLDHLENLLDTNTRLVALGAAANSCGSITDIAAAATIVRRLSPKALLYVDGVHYAPHRLPDVQALGCDLFVCSAYKFCGPHAGILWGRKEVLERLEPFKLTACSNLLPSGASQSSRWETGTANFESISGIKACIEYLATLDSRAGSGKGVDLRERLEASYRAIRDHEEDICKLFLATVADLASITVHGVTDVKQVGQRTPTFCLTMTGVSGPSLAQQLVDRGIACGAGHFYALNFPKVANLEEGVFVRLSFCHYHTMEEVKTVLKALQDIVRRHK